MTLQDLLELIRMILNHIGTCPNCLTCAQLAKNSLLTIDAADEQGGPPKI